jgi:hypothetical protein
MQHYIIVGASRDTGRDLRIELLAETESEARDLAAQRGIVVQNVSLANPALSASLELIRKSESLEQRIGRLQQQIGDLHGDLSRHHKLARRFNNAPVSNIAWGVFLGLFLWMVFWFLVAVALFALGIWGVASAAAGYEGAP